MSELRKNFLFHLENSINIPLHEVQDRVEELRLITSLVLLRSGKEVVD